MVDSIIKYYNEGRYTDDQMKVFVIVKWITQVQYKEITGAKYTK